MSPAGQQLQFPEQVNQTSKKGYSRKVKSVKRTKLSLRRCLVQYNVVKVAEGVHFGLVGPLFLQLGVIVGFGLGPC